MAAKKHKYKSLRQVAPDQLVKGASELLQLGKIEEALRDLRQAEKELQPRTSLAGRKLSTPPHLIAARTALPPLLARALATRARAAANVGLQLADLAEAVKYAPTEPRYRVALGACRSLAGDAAGALNEFQAAHDSNNDLTARALAFGLLAHDRAAEADAQNLKVLRDVLNRAPVTTTDPLLTGVSHLLAGDAAQAQTAFAELPALTRNPSRAEAARLATQFFYSGWLNVATQRTQAAFGDWREAQRLLATHHLTPAWRDRFIGACRQTAERADPAYAQAGWQLVLQLAPNDQSAQSRVTATLRAQALQAWRDGDHQQAATLWQQALSMSQQDEALLRNLAIACEKLERKSEAATHWRALAKLWRQQFSQRRDEPAFKERLLKLGQHLINLLLDNAHSEQDEQVIADELEAALKLDPDNQVLRQRAVEILTELERPQPALKHLEALAAQKGQTAEFFARKAMAYDQMERYADARKSFEKARALEPDSAFVRRAYVAFLGNEAERAAQNGNLKQAIVFCEEQLTFDPQNEAALTRLAAMYFDTGQPADGQRIIERLLAIESKNPGKYILAGGLYLKNGKKKEAEALFKKALALDTSARSLLTIGICHWVVQNIKEALKYFDRAAETADVEMLLEIAMQLAEAGRAKDAERFLKKASALDPTNPIPHLTRAMSLMHLGNPLAMLGLKKQDLAAARVALAEAERLMAGRAEYAEMMPDVRQMKQMIAQGPLPGLGGLLSGLGGRGALPPFFFDDFGDDEFGGGGGGGFADFPFLPPRSAKKNKPKKKK